MDDYIDLEKKLLTAAKTYSKDRLKDVGCAINIKLDIDVAI